MQKTNKHIVCFGEVLWDVYPDKQRLGGAPLNVAAHAKQLGCNSTMISKIGNDANGKAILKELEALNLSTAYLQIDEALATGTVKVALDKRGQPTYEIVSPVAWDNILFNQNYADLVRQSDAFIFGTLACRNETSYQTLLKLLEVANFKILDLNIRQNFYNKTLVEQLLLKTDFLKINEEEFKLLGQLFDVKLELLYQHLTAALNIKAIIVTKGGDGVELYHNKTLTKVESKKVKVVDTVGAGDAFLASFIVNYLNKEDLRTCLTKAGNLAAYVATKPGAIPQHENKASL